MVVSFVNGLFLSNVSPMVPGCRELVHAAKVEFTRRDPVQEKEAQAAIV